MAYFRDWPENLSDMQGVILEDVNSALGFGNMPYTTGMPPVHDADVQNMSWFLDCVEGADASQQYTALVTSACASVAQRLAYEADPSAVTRDEQKRADERHSICSAAKDSSASLQTKLRPRRVRLRGQQAAMATWCHTGCICMMPIR